MGFQHSYGAFPTWLILRDSILTGQHYSFDPVPYSILFENSLAFKAPTDTIPCIYYYNWVGAMLPTLRNLRVHLLDTSKDSTILTQNKYLILHKYSIFVPKYFWPICQLNYNKDQGDSGLDRDSTIWLAATEVSSTYWRNCSSVQSDLAPFPSASRRVDDQ